MKTKLTISIFALAFLFSCQKDKKLNTSNDAITTSEKDENFALQTFTALPELQDCFIYIAKSKEAFETEEFIFADDYGNTAYIKIEDEMIKIPLEEGDFDPAESERKIIFEKVTIEMQLEPIEQDENEEELIFKGQMKVTKDGNVYETNIYGKSSC